MKPSRKEELDEVLQSQLLRSSLGLAPKRQRRVKAEDSLVRKTAARIARGFQQKESKEKRVITRKAMRKRDALDYATEIAYRGRQRGQSLNFVGYPLSESAPSSTGTCPSHAPSFLSSLRKFPPPHSLSKIVDMSSERESVSSVVSKVTPNDFDDDTYSDDDTVTFHSPDAAHDRKKCDHFTDTEEEGFTQCVSMSILSE